MPTAKILIADDDNRIRYLLKEILTDRGYQVLEASDGYQVLEIFQNNIPDLVLLDLKMPGIDGIQVLNKLKQFLSATIFIVITAHGTIRNAIEATRLGVYDFIEKPIEEERLIILIENALKSKSLERENVRLKDVLLSEYQIIGKSNSMAQIHEFIDRSAATDANVLITGSNGTGKDLVARNIHLKSNRNDKNFVLLNCAAIPENLIESELFGYEKGAFTGANRTYRGKFESADGGTIFLNEIGEMSPATQAKLLHVLEMKSIQRLGGDDEIKIDVRILSATNKDISQAIINGEFRQDLFYRLDVLHLHLPDLKDHPEDILPLFDHFMEQVCLENGLNVKKLSPHSIKRLYNYHWPGNIRQLKNVVTNLAMLYRGTYIEDQDVKKILAQKSDGFKTEIVEKDFSLFKARIDFEREYITRYLEENNWNVRKTAEILQVERTHLYKLLNKLGIELLKQ